jgi:class 3 adenylate cyclase/ABC-type transport system substrate-binding protein/tRNA A-37 threonylcarbamoyl transferase component Bud32/streptogramin lyase
MSVELPSGTVVAGFRVERLLGRGATGSVYLARDEHLDRAVALKLLPPELSRDERFRQRFLRESRLAAALEHPGIVPIYSAGESDGHLFIAMRYVGGSDLRQLLQLEGRFEPERALEILSRIAQALDAAHERGLVHRDVKPGNILVEDGNRAFLADFGLAKHAATVNSLSREGVFSGTIDYIAPEQIEGTSVDGRADVYALACVFFELLAGRPPFQRETDIAVVFAHLKELPPAVTALRPDLPGALDEVLARGMAKDPDDRYRTASQLIEDVREALGGGDVSIPRRAAQLRTFLIADVRGYTRYTQQHGDEAAAALATGFADIVREVVSSHDGRLIELRGDEALVVFESARQALQAALGVQGAVAEKGLARGVGIGVDAGEAVPVGKGYRGGALNMAARLCSLARPGEVLASEAVVHLARTVPGVRYLQGRLERLKGIEHPVRIVEVVPQETAVALLRGVRRRLRGRRWPIAVLAGVLVVLAVAAGIVVARGGGKPKLSALRSVAAFTPDGKLSASVPTGVDTFDEKYLDGFVWSLNDGGTLVKIDPRKEEVVQAVPVGTDAGWTVGGGSVWVDDANKPDVIRVNAQYGSTSRIRLPKLPDGPQNPTAIAYGAGSLWVSQGPRILRLDPATGKVRATIESNDAHILSFGDGALYAVTQYSGDFVKIDPASNTVQWRAHLHPWLADLKAAAGWVWVTVDSDAGVYRFNETDGSQSGFLRTGDGSGALAFGAGSVWVGNWRAGTVSRVDPVSFAVKTFPTGNAPNGLAVTPDGRVWMGIAARPPDYAASLKGDVAHFVLREDWLDQNDPGSAWAQRPWELEYATEAKLYNYPDWAGPDPARPAPEIAAGYPEVVHRGGVWTYTIPIRSTYRFSPPSNAPVTAESMRYTIERSLSPGLSDGFQPASLFLTNLVGEDAFRSGKAAHIEGLVVRGSRLVLTTTRPVADLVERLAMPFFSAVPAGTPLADFDTQRHPIPTAGPYYISYQNTGWQTVVRRNPNYRGPRPHRLDAVVYVAGIDTGPAAAQIVKGELDYLAEAYPDFGALEPGGNIARRFASANPNGAGRPRYVDLFAPGLRWLSLNTRHGPLADTDARRAINAVIDRRALAAADGGIPADQYLPAPLMGAARDQHQYSVTGPELARAKQLWAGRADRLVLLTCKSPLCTQQANILRRNFAGLGVRLVVRAAENSYGASTRGVDMRMDNWFVDEYDPSNMLGDPDSAETVLFSHDPGINAFGNWSDPLVRKAAAAGRLSGDGRRQAFSALAQEALRTWVPWAVFEQMGQPAFFSARLGCISSSPAYFGVDIARLCIRND